MIQRLLEPKCSPGFLSGTGSLPRQLCLISDRTFLSQNSVARSRCALLQETRGTAENYLGSITTI